MDAVNLVIEQGYSATETSRRLGINRSNITRRLREHRDGLGKLPINSDSPQELQDEIKRLRKENKRLLMERDILKKAAAFFANESK